jgi:hypothetical protein
MHPSLRPLLLATGAFLASALPASAQFIELVTESPVTLQVSLSTPNREATATSRRTTTTVSRLSNAQIVEELRQAGVIPNEPATGWTLVAVREVPADLGEVDASFTLFATNPGAAQPVRIPDSKFESAAYLSVERYTERHQGQYVLTSRGTVTNHVGYQYLPSIAVSGVNYTIGTSRAEGFATVLYASKDLAAPYSIFFYGINSVRVTAIGSFNGQRQIGANPAEETAGLISLTLSLGAAKLTPAAPYDGQLGAN